jgi:intraflagellar transport protein 172
VRPAGQLLPPEGIEASSSKSDTIDQHHRDVVKSLKITLNKSAVTAICYSHDNERIAVATKDRIITLYNHKGEQVDRFNTKQNSNYADGDTTKKDYIIRSIQFAPPCSADHHDDSGKDQLQSPKLAVAQSDAIVFIYKWKSHNQHPRGKKNNSTQHGDQHNDEGHLMMEQARKKSNTGIHTGTTLAGSSSSSCKWSGKKSISNKFMEDSPITALVWSRKHPYQVVYGLHQGKVRIGNLRTNKAQTLYKGSSDTAAADKNDSNPVISLALNLNGTELLSGHQDGSIYKFIFPTSTSTKIKSSACTNLIKVSIIPYTLSWGRSICIGGTNGKISFYSHDGQEEQCFVYNNNNNNNNTKNTDHEGVSTMLQHNHELTSEEKSRISSQFTTSIFSPSGDDVIVGSFDCFYLFSWSAATKCWEERNIHIVKNMYSITALDWKANGSSIILGTSSGLIDEYDATFRQFTYKDSFLITYVSPSQLLIRDKDEVNSCPILIQSSKGREIVKVKIYHDPGTTVYRYVVASTKQSLILCDMESPLSSTSEIPWSFQKELHEKFIFDAANACVISNAGELSIVEVSCSDIVSHHCYMHVLSIISFV